MVYLAWKVFPQLYNGLLEIKMNRFLMITFLLIIPLYGLSKATEELVKSMVPRGEVAVKRGNDYAVRTQAGTKIMVEFNRGGELDEASGLNSDTGDIFEPGNGLITLSSAAQVAEREGHKIKGEWRLENDPTLGWIYELEGRYGEESLEYVVNARTAQLIKTDD